MHKQFVENLYFLFQDSNRTPSLIRPSKRDYSANSRWWCTKQEEKKNESRGASGTEASQQNHTMSQITNACKKREF